MEDAEPLESRLVVVDGGVGLEILTEGVPGRIGQDPPSLPSDQCAHLAHGSGAWCDCMGAAIDAQTDLYAACEDVMSGEGPIDVTLYMWCASLDQDFDDWWDAC